MRLLLLAACVLGLSATHAKADENMNLQFDSAYELEVSDDLAGLSSVDEAITDLSAAYRRGRPMPHRRVACFARNGRGVVFRAIGVGYPPRFIQRSAVNYCRRNSFVPNSCRALGCRF
ncbi:MAG: hypothetical protein M9962_10800 [Oligoflexia bacterium]|nr:hypothetical protein [Oligoflexia bacterium]